MQRNYLFLTFLFFGFFGFSQYPYEPSVQHPYGLPNPEAPQQILDFAPLIGECNCSSVARNADQTWAKPIDMIWRFKYIMNGMAVQDETLKADGKHSGSIRQFIPDSTKWYVHYYNSGVPSTQLPTWEGSKNKKGAIVLYKEQKAPNGTEGFFRLSFYDITDSGYKWIGEWVNTDETITYPTWKIACTRKEAEKHANEKEKLMEVSRKFSKDFMNADYKAMAEAYTKDGKLFPMNSEIIEGHKAIQERWAQGKDAKILFHAMNPVQINFVGDHAFDYGYYQGKTQNKDGAVSDWDGKYVVVWKKIDGVWKMYLDIWNRTKP